MHDMELEVKGAQRGDREAFIRLFRRLEPELYRLAKSIVRRDEDIADAFQETTLKAYKSLATLQKPKYFKTWVIRILINECNQLLRNRVKTVAMAEVPEASRSAGYYEDSHKLDLHEALESLDESLRIVIHLFYFQDLPIKQISGVLDISEGAVRARLHRARGILADRVKHTREGKLSYETH
ncbi:sigma-70 family RNA polymerase sigma factor [Paenibacillus campinasensis]|uniref:Sigma-70 family RNA polymerase sigma factor n=2 Tax=Paenibacillus campinasensis TaxID=66347 RepID=A0ABW9T6J4_9BACL|nr:sigma-70 family RNA polymerase sigma factor [Paenibacillus campinasensis]